MGWTRSKTPTSFLVSYGVMYFCAKGVKAQVFYKTLKKMRKILKIVCLCAALQIVPLKGVAGDFSINFTSEGLNFWTGAVLNPVTYLNAILANAEMDEADHVDVVGLQFDWVTFKANQGTFNVKRGKYFGWKARDLFNHLGCGVRFGYQPSYSVLGIFVQGGYKFRQFRTNTDDEVDVWDKYKLHSWYAGASIRITPFLACLKRHDWSPIVEVGTNYNQVFSCKAPYDNDTDQFGKGVSVRIAAGLRFEYTSVLLSYEMYNYDFLNRDFVSSDGTMPYADIKSKTHGIGLTISKDF